jgi:geranyl-CoA carboxylase alpha subunit
MRCDHALGDGVVVPPFYDSMLAKLVAHGPTRDAARLQLIAAADACVVLGLDTNRAFLVECLRDEVFAAGGATTAFVEQRFPRERRAVRDERSVAAALLVRGERRYPAELAGWSNGVLEPRAVRMELDGEIVEASPGHVDLARVRFVRDGEHVHFDVDAGPHHTVIDLSHRPRRHAGDSAAAGRIVAPINGRVIAVEGAGAERVEKGQLLAVIEAMKMEHRVLSPVAGRVAACGVRVGQQVAPGDLIAEIT